MGQGVAEGGAKTAIALNAVACQHILQSKHTGKTDLQNRWHWHGRYAAELTA